MEVSNAYSNIPVLVTGGAGFIGSHLVEQLVLAGAHVTVLDDCSTGNIENIIHLKNQISFIQASITDFQTCYKAAQGIHIVFHLAAYISVPLSIEYPLECYERNIHGTMNILEASHQAGVQRFIFSSSAAVYGTQKDTCVESMLCTPESPYGYSKWIGELLCQQYANSFGLKTICLRYFNVYGKRQNPHGSYAGVVAKFKDQMQKNLPITIFGDGTQTRDFIPVEQIVQANMQLGLTHARSMNGSAYNIATGASKTLLDLIALLKKEYPHYSKDIMYADKRLGDIDHSSANCSAYQRLQQELIEEMHRADYQTKFYGTKRFREENHEASVSTSTNNKLLPVRL